MLIDDHDCRVTIDPVEGGRVTSCELRGWEVVVGEGVDLFHWGNFAMAPWLGRLRDGVLDFGGRQYEFPVNAAPHALHGLVTSLVWDEVGPGTVAVDLPEPWPWKGRVAHKVTVEPGRVIFELSLVANEAMPAAIGWHPWFPRTINHRDGREAGPVAMEIEPGSMYENDAAGLPTGKLVPPIAPPWDYCFRDLARPPAVRWPGAVEIEITSDCSDWVIYDMEPQAICVEPWTAPPNSVNLPHPYVVTPERPLVATMSWNWSTSD